jgi:hypothetical protein
MTERQATLAHEAGHAVGSLLAGHRIDVVRVGSVKDGLVGSCEIDQYQELDPFGHLVAVLMGPLAAGESPPPWPPTPHAKSGTDEREAAMLVHLGITREQYHAACGIAAHYVTDHRVKAAVARVAEKLGTLGSLTNVMVKDAAGEEFMRWVHEGLLLGAEYDAA